MVLSMSITDQDLAIEAAAAGAAVVRSHYGSALARFDKDGGDFATSADIDAEKAILDVLRARRARTTSCSVRRADVRAGRETGDCGWSTRCAGR
jgi:myo-inositol-1(or 4)-monophosphatase